MGRLNRVTTPDDKPRRHRIVTCGNPRACRVMCGPTHIRGVSARIDAGREARDRHGRGDTYRHAAGRAGPGRGGLQQRRRRLGRQQRRHVADRVDHRGRRRSGDRAEEDGAGVHREDRDQGQHRRGRRGPVRPGDHLGRGRGHAAGRGRGAAAVRVADAGVRRPARHRHGEEGRRRPRRGHVRGPQPRPDQGRRQAARRAQRRLGPAAGLPAATCSTRPGWTRRRRTTRSRRRRRR